MILALVLATQMTLADSVRQTFRGYEQALNAGDYQALGRYYADDPRFYWIEHGHVYTRAEIIKGLSQTPAGGRFTYDEPRITIVDQNVALLFTHYSGTMGSAKFTGDMTITLIRTSAGWRFLEGQS